MAAPGRPRGRRRTVAGILVGSRRAAAGGGPFLCRHPDAELPRDEEDEEAREQRSEQEAGGRAPHLGHRTGEEATDRCAAGEDHDVQAHHPAAQLVVTVFWIMTLMVLTISIEAKPRNRITT